MNHVLPGVSTRGLRGAFPRSFGSSHARTRRGCIVAATAASSNVIKYRQDKNVRAHTSFLLSTFSQLSFISRIPLLLSSLGFTCALMNGKSNRFVKLSPTLADWLWLRGIHGENIYKQWNKKYKRKTVKVREGWPGEEAMLNHTVSARYRPTSHTPHGCSCNGVITPR